jgi:hypothetical protein
MHEILRHLPADSFVLDLGCAMGSFADVSTAAKAIRLDQDKPTGGVGTRFVQGDAGKLPFGDRTFAAVIANHSLEHFEEADAALREIGRVLRSDGALFIAVPDASTITDKLYRWLAGGGGHVNSFTSATDLAARIERGTGFPHVATIVLYSSLSFLNSRNSPRPRPLPLILLGGGSEGSLRIYSWLSRRLDRWLHTRTSVYGWALYFGRVDVDSETGANVCIRCGSGVSVAFLAAGSLIRGVFPGVRVFECPGCGATNPFFE